MSVPAAFAAFTEPRFRWWFVCQITSASGLLAQGTGMAWLVLQVGGTAVDLALVGTFGLLPLLIGGAWGGVLSDRFDRRRLLIITHAAAISIGIALTAITALGMVTVPLLYLFSCAAGAVGAIDGPARQLFVLDLVGRSRLTSAVSLHEVVINTSRILGPSIGGLLLGLFGAVSCFAVNTVTFLPPLVFLLLTAGARQSRGEAADDGRGVRHGFAYAARHSVIRSCLLLAVPMTVIFNAGLLYPVWMTEVLGFTAAQYGAAMAAFGLGALPGALAASARRRGPSGHSVLVLTVCTAVVVGPLGFLKGFPVVAAAMAALGFVSIWMIAGANTLVQLRAEPAVRGRVMGIWVMVLPGAGVLTYGLTGLVVDRFGVAAAFVALAVALVVAAAVSWTALAPRAAGQHGPLGHPEAV